MIVEELNSEQCRNPKKKHRLGPRVCQVVKSIVMECKNRAGDPEVKGRWRGDGEGVCRWSHLINIESWHNVVTDVHMIPSSTLN